MRFRKNALIASFWAGLLFCIPSQAAQLSSCSSATFICTIYEETNIDISNLSGAISGDIVLMEGSTVGDVFRIFNDFVDTGGGTGIGLTASFFSRDEGNLPNPSTYSANAVFIQKTGGVTRYANNGDTYLLLDSPVPEPSTLLLFSAGMLGLAAVKHRVRISAALPHGTGASS